MSLQELALRAKAREFLKESVSEAGPTLLKALEREGGSNLIEASISTITWLLFLDKLKTLDKDDRVYILESVPGIDVWNPSLSLLQAIRTYF